MASQFIHVGTDRRSVRSRNIAMRVTKSGRGIFYALEPNTGRPGLCRLLSASDCDDSFDENLRSHCYSARDSKS